MTTFHLFNSSTNIKNVNRRPPFMKRRGFFKAMALAGLVAPLTVRESAGYVVAHNWDKYDFGSGPPVKNRLNQGPFPEYAPEDLYPGGDVVMATTPAEDVVPNFGKGSIARIVPVF
jgi:hypothetical protein